MNTQVTETKTFEQRMIDRVKEGAADLLTDEDVKKIVERGIESLFFKERPDPSSTSFNRKQLSPLAIEMVTNAVKQQVNEQIVVWVAQNEEHLNSIVKELFEENIGQTIVNSLSGMFQNSFQSMSFNLQNDIQNMVQNRGG